MKSGRFLVSLVFLPLVFFIAQTPALGSKADEALLSRVHQYWQATLNDDWKTLYQFLPPQDRSLVTEEQFATSSREKLVFKYSSYTIADHQIDDEHAWVRVEYNLDLRPPFPPVPTKRPSLWTKWSTIENSWYPTPVLDNDNSPTFPPKLRDPVREAQLRERAHQYWTAVEQQDWEAVYNFLAPPFRDAQPLQEFLTRKPLNKYSSHSISWVEVTQQNPAVGTVRTFYYITPNDPSLSKAPPALQIDKDTWVYMDDNWYRPVGTDQ